MKDKNVRTRLNYYWIIVTVLLLLVMVGYTTVMNYMMFIIYIVTIEKSLFALLCFIPSILFSSLTIAMFIRVSRRMNYIIANEKGVKIAFPMKLKSVFVEWDKIKGYSKSDYYYGGRILLKSKSIVIYTKSGKNYEIIKLYNFDFQDFQSGIRKFRMVCFGHEGFVTKTHKLLLVKRVYKYDDIFNQNN